MSFLKFSGYGMALILRFWGGFCEFAGVFRFRFGASAVVLGWISVVFRLCGFGLDFMSFPKFSVYGLVGHFCCGLALGFPSSREFLVTAWRCCCRFGLDFITQNLKDTSL